MNFNKLIEFNNVAKRWFQTQTKETLFSKSIERAVELIRPYFEDKGGYNERANKINRDTAAKDTKHSGVLLTDQMGAFRYTVAGLQRRDDLMNELGEEIVEIDFEDCYCSELPELTLEQKMILKGIVINPIKKEVPALAIAE